MVDTICLEESSGVAVDGTGVDVVIDRGAVPAAGKRPVRINSFRCRSIAWRLTPNWLAITCEDLPSFKSCSTVFLSTMAFLAVLLFLVIIHHTSMLLNYCQEI
jgi:hypothetical protein